MISQLCPGDIVVGYDTEQQRTVPAIIRNVWSHAHRGPLCEILIDYEVIVCTPEHPFYCYGSDWIAANMLKAGDEVASPSGGYSLVQEVCHIKNTSDVIVWNISVEWPNTYFVGARETVVHNKGP